MHTPSQTFALEAFAKLCSFGTKRAILAAYQLRDNFACACDECKPVMAEMNRLLERADATLLAAEAERCSAQQKGKK